MPFRSFLGERYELLGIFYEFFARAIEFGVCFNF